MLITSFSSIMASRYPLEKAKEAVRLSASSLGYPTLKTLQEEVIVQFVMGHDVFVGLDPDRVR